MSIAGVPRISETFDTEEEAERARNARVAVLASKGLAPTGSEMLRTFAERFLDARETSGAFRSIDAQRSVWRRRIAPTVLAEMAPASIRLEHVKAWAKDAQRMGARASVPWLAQKGGEIRMSGHRVSRQTVKHAWNLLRVMLLEALGPDRTPLASVRFKDLGIAWATETQDDWTYLTASEMALVRVSDRVTEDERDMMEVAWGVGTRPGELFRISRADVELDGEHPEVKLQFSWDAPTTKNGKVRFVPLVPTVVAAFRRIFARHPKRTGLVFTTKTGRPHRRGSTGGWADRRGAKSVLIPGIRTRAGIERHVTFYAATRDTCASHLLMGTMGKALTLAEVGKWLGHSEAKVTERYARVSEEHLRGVARGLHGVGAERLGHRLDTPPATNGNNRNDDEPPEPKVTGSNPVSRASFSGNPHSLEVHRVHSVQPPRRRQLR